MCWPGMYRPMQRNLNLPTQAVKSISIEVEAGSAAAGERSLRILTEVNTASVVY